MLNERMFAFNNAITLQLLVYCNVAPSLEKNVLIVIATKQILLESLFAGNLAQHKF